MIKHLQNNLSEISQLIQKLNNKQYSEKQEVLSFASIGQHVRHVLEFYICLLFEVKAGVVSYEKRKRDLRIENDIHFAIQTIDSINAELSEITQDLPLKLTFIFALEPSCLEIINTTLYRELAYNMEHCVHHQALIKIGLNNLTEDIKISDSFGVSAATIQYRNLQCAQ